MKNFFALVAGEALTLESLNYYLATLANRARATRNVNPNQLIIAASKGNTPPDDVLLGALQENIHRLNRAVYRHNKPEETNLQRKSEIDHVLGWFIHNLPDESGAKLKPVLDVLGLKPVEFLSLLIEQMSYTNADLGNTFGEAKTVSQVFKKINFETLFMDVPPQGMTIADLEVARTWVYRYTQTAFLANGPSLGEAYTLAEDRANHMTSFAEMIGRADPDLVTYARNQLIADGRLQLAS
jgi:antitoxin component HigA of HigAB toxin-antitoxin module